MQARRALDLSQEGLGKLLGVSRRTSARWEWGKSVPAPAQLHALARAVHPRARDVAARVAEQVGATLVSLGLEDPPAPPEPPPRPVPPVALLVESVVCAAAEALDTKPAAVRDVLRAAFHRARAMSLTVEDVDAVLTPAAPQEPPPAKRKEAALPAKTRELR